MLAVFQSLSLDVPSGKAAENRSSEAYLATVPVIESISGTTITVLNQNMAGSPVIRTTIDLATMTGGSFAVYRAVPK